MNKKYLQCPTLTLCCLLTVYYTYLISFSVTISCTVTFVWHATGVTIKCMSIAVTSKMLIKNMMLIRDLVHKPKNLVKRVIYSELPCKPNPEKTRIMYKLNFKQNPSNENLC